MLPRAPPSPARTRGRRQPPALNALRAPGGCSSPEVRRQSEWSRGGGEGGISVLRSLAAPSLYSHPCLCPWTVSAVRAKARLPVTPASSACSQSPETPGWLDPYVLSQTAGCSCLTPHGGASCVPGTHRCSANCLVLCSHSPTCSLCQMNDRNHGSHGLLSPHSSWHHTRPLAFLLSIAGGQLGERARAGAQQGTRTVGGPGALPAA